VVWQCVQSVVSRVILIESKRSKSTTKEATGNDLALSVVPLQPGSVIPVAKGLAECLTGRDQRSRLQRDESRLFDAGPHLQVAEVEHPRRDR
jgi:hypothetical protein